MLSPSMKNGTRVAPDVHPPMQCQQGPFWGRKFVKKLARAEKNTLSIWLSGAIWTPTHRFIQRPPKNDQRRCSCFFSDEPCASAKHFFLNCPSFENFRYQLQLQFYVPPTWWEKQPCCSCKSGWIIFLCRPDLEPRVSHAIAANTHGIHIATTVFAEKNRFGL